MSDLKPCAHCGGKGMIKRGKTVMVSCLECSASTFQVLNDPESAIAAWNRRAAPQASESTAPDTSQDWAKLDGATAFHLIERHADDWTETGSMMESWATARFGALAMEVLREPSAPVGDGTADKPSARENFANILRIQRAEAETGDPYMIGLYNGMSMMCANFDNVIDWDMLPVRAADVAHGGAVEMTGRIEWSEIKLGAVHRLIEEPTTAAAQQQAATVPDGFVLVPVEPTEAMIHAAEDIPPPRAFGKVYRAMIRAAATTDGRDGT